MSDRTETVCDVCGKVIAHNPRSGGPSVEPKDGALRVSFSAYFYGMEWERNEPPSGDTCSTACAVKMLRVALAYLDPDWRRDMEEGANRIGKRKR